MNAVACPVLAAELARLDALIHREILRLRARYELSLDELRGLYVSDEQVDALLRDRCMPQPEFDRPIPPAPTEPSRWSHACAALGLSDDERQVLIACVAPELDSRYEALYAYLNNDLARRWPTADLCARAFATDAERRTALRGVVAPGSRLIETGAIEVLPGQRDLPRAQRGLRASAAISGWVQGLPYVDERLAAVAYISADTPREDSLIMDAEPRGALSRVASRLSRRSPLPPVFLVADAAADAATAATWACSQAGRPAIIVDLAAVARNPAPGDVVHAISLMQSIMGYAIVASPVDALIGVEGRACDEACLAIRRLCARSPALLLAAADGARARQCLGDANLLDIRLAEPAPRERRRLWRQSAAADVPPAVLAALADRFRFGPARIRQACGIARNAAIVGEHPHPSPAHLFAAARAVSLDAANEVPTTIATAFTWDDLVLPEETSRRLRDLLAAVELRSQVLDDWGFSGRIGGARGVRALFAGPSGTGKTMAAAIVARTLELDMHRIDLSSVMSKYIGETEKNLDRAFAGARRCNAMLFIDEADALLGKRSEVRDAHDRYANIETAYLLQKMEEHDGVVILATNLARNIDEAFARRMQYVIEFPLPDAAARERLWRGMFPAKAPLSPDLDFGFLARQFPLAGGDIRNMVLDAAYDAARNDEPIGLARILRAVARQYAKRGQVPTVAQFQEHFALVQDPPMDTPRLAALATRA